MIPNMLTKIPNMVMNMPRIKNASAFISIEGEAPYKLSVF